MIFAAFCEVLPNEKLMLFDSTNSNRDKIDSFTAQWLFVNLAVVAEFLKSNYLGGKIPIFTSPHWEVAPWQITFTVYLCKILQFN